MDVVYILKLDNFNYDLAYSLRSLYHNATGYDRVWCVGYAPTWVSPDVDRIVTNQGNTKWRNALDNLVAACKHPDISDDFVLFNDDFFAINKVNLATDLYLARGTIDDIIKRHRDNDVKETTWTHSFAQIKELLIKLGSIHFMDFTLHIPMIINKHKFLKVYNLPEVQEHLEKYNSLSYRNLYGNMFYTEPMLRKDCKLNTGVDATDEQLKGQWLSVYDNVTNSLHKYPKLASVLKSFKKCPYEQRSIL